MANTQPPKLRRVRLVARTDVPDFRDYMYEPALVNLKPKLEVPDGLFIRHQLSSNACTGFALAAVIDRLILEAGYAKPVNVSALMLYDMARRYDEFAGEDDLGSSCRGAIKGWYNMGVCREDLYPFDKKENKGYTIKAAKDARNNTTTLLLSTSLTYGLR